MQRGWSQSHMASNISFPRRGSSPIAVASQKKKMFSLKDKFKLSSLTREEIIAFFCSLSIHLSLQIWSHAQSLYFIALIQ